MEIRIEKKLTNHNPNTWYYVNMGGQIFIVRGNILEINPNVFTTIFGVASGDVIMRMGINLTSEINEITEIRKATQREIDVAYGGILTYFRNYYDVVYDAESWYLISFRDGRRYFTRGFITTEPSETYTYIEWGTRKTVVTSEPIVINYNKIMRVRRAYSDELTLIREAHEETLVKLINSLK